MNKAKLKEAEERFIMRYPGGFSNPRMVELAKKHKVEKMKNLAQDSFSIGQFESAINIVDFMDKVVSQSSLISIFEKPKFRDLVKVMNENEKEHLSHGLKEFLHGDQAFGFRLMTGLLQEYKLAKWPLLTVYPIYYRPSVEVFIKPTTAKGIIEYFELIGIKYNSNPTFEFYQAYREQIMQMKQEVDISLQVDNAAFCGFLMMAMENYAGAGM
ncbi:Hypothetical protein LUCI_3413 [Lucifera butyrica]|uniref:Uncharacterized protein n=1 Tax=Lucifera butyrica TaxID=1351585 RepID=A0A498RGB3_9FIRM|nr:hypothetical protein [Lucifera butyrica]VBB08148.1 Hypothetical protein LUCI_3413 [Lucifera butyrica]